VTTGTPVVEVLQGLEPKGMHLGIFSTCLHHFGLEDQVEMGVVGGMTDIIEAHWQADKMITL
jgi:hypothetical protein